jgi:hypothetical protein
VSERGAKGEVDAVPDRAGAGPRHAVGGGALLLLVGLAMVAVGPSKVGMAVTLLALPLLIYGIHTFGRLGPDGPPGASVR